MANQQPIPYQPSWLNRIIAWVDRLPLPAWLFYLLLYLFLHILFSVFKWFDGRLPFWTIDFKPHNAVIWGVGPLAIVHYLDIAAVQALETFRTALDLAEDDFRRIQYELTTPPARPTLIASLLWPLVGLVAFAFTLRPVLATFTIWEIVITTITFVIGGAFIYHTIHQLRTVSQILERVTHVNLLYLQPYYAFSGLTARTLILWLLLIYTAILTVPAEVNWGSFGILFILQNILAIAAFLLPLLGIHRVIRSEKHRHQSEIAQQMHLAMESLYKANAAQNFGGVDAMNKMISSLLTIQDRIEKAPTWPWERSTLRGFATAILLPIALDSSS